MATRAEKQITEPSHVEPGDAPADTTDPTENVSTVEPDKAAAAAAGHLTVNAAVPIDLPSPEEPAIEGKGRVEKYEAVRPDGTTVTVTRNIDTGDAKVSKK